MRKIFSISIATLALLAGGCANWLDVEPTDKILEKKAYQSEIGINNIVNGFYRTMTGDNLYGNAMAGGTVDFLAHYYDFPDTSIGGKSDLYSLYQIGTYRYDDLRESTFKGMWSSGYSFVLELNNFIANMEKLEGNAVISEERRKLYLGEAYGLRAMMHLDLYRLFGPMNATGEAGVLPYHENATIEIPTYLAPTAFLEQVLEDLDTATDLMVDTDPIKTTLSVHDGAAEDDNLNSTDRFAMMFRNKRMNYWAVQLLKARAQMLLGTPEALSEVVAVTSDIATNAIAGAPSAVIPFAWTPSNNNWSANAVLYDEVIFGPTKLDLGNWWTKHFAQSNRPDGNTLLVVQTNLIDNIQISAGDSRYAQWGISSTMGQGLLGDIAGEPYYRTKKFAGDNYEDTTSEGQLGFWTLNMRALMRISEVMYMRAEAKLKSGDLPGAIVDINTVLARRNFQEQLSGNYSATGLLPAGATEANVWDMLRLEYYREFALEGQTWFFLKRNDLDPVAGNAAGNQVNFSSDNFVLPRPDNETDFDPEDDAEEDSDSDNE